MDDRLKNLTEKLYSEGVEKGKQEADSILAKAKEEANKIIESAKAEANGIVEKAGKEAQETRRKLETELSLSIKQSIGQLQNNISKLLTVKMTDVSINEALNKDFMQKLIVNAVQSWDKGTSNIDLTLILPKGQESELSGFIKSNLKKELDKGLEVAFSDALKSGLQIKPSDGSYTIDFSEESFMNFFKDYLRPITKKILFES